MPKIDVDRILSANSEDSAYPAVNLIHVDNKKPWKCKPGEKQATVILQLKQETSIEAIDIGNEHSAFVEVLVGKSTSISNDYKVLLVASSLMTLKESKDGTNARSVRFFKKDQLTQPTVEEKWDRVKIVCTQPFNKHVQYGLSFVVLHSSSKSEEEEGSKALGRFMLKQEVEDEPVAVGSLFAKRKDPPPPIPAKAAASIRDASSPANIALGKAKKPTPKRPKKDAAEAKKQTPKAPARAPAKPKFNFIVKDDEDSPADDTDADSNYSPTKDRTSVLSDDDDIPQSDDDSDQADKRPKRAKKVNVTNQGTSKNTLNGQTLKRKVADSGDSSSSKAKIAKQSDRETRPFNRLMEGVTFVISGYQNPLRAELRTKAIEMGARYKPDWDPQCTHLICAFMNTPKFSQVQGRGKIVKKDWIEECHSRRKRLPWRRFALDRNHAGTSSEEEVWEEVPMPSSSQVNSVIASGINRRTVSSGSGSDTEEEIERVKAKKAANTKNNIPQTTSTTSVKTPVAVKVKDEEDAYGDDTDIDCDEETGTSKLPLPPLPNFFQNAVIHIALDIEEQERKMLHRYITAYQGTLVDETDQSIEFVISNSAAVAETFSEHLDATVVSPEWVWKSSDAAKLLPPSQFLLNHDGT